MTDRELLALMAAILQTAKPGADAMDCVYKAREILGAVVATTPEPQDRAPRHTGAFGLR